MPSIESVLPPPNRSPSISMAPPQRCPATAVERYGVWPRNNLSARMSQVVHPFRRSGSTNDRSIHPWRWFRCERQRTWPGAPRQNPAHGRPTESRAASRRRTSRRRRYSASRSVRGQRRRTSAPRHGACATGSIWNETASLLTETHGQAVARAVLPPIQFLVTQSAGLVLAQRRALFKVARRTRDQRLANATAHRFRLSSASPARRVALVPADIHAIARR